MHFKTHLGNWIKFLSFAIIKIIRYVDLVWPDGFCKFGLKCKYTWNDNSIFQDLSISTNKKCFQHFIFPFFLFLYVNDLWSNNSFKQKLQYVPKCMAMSQNKTQTISENSALKMRLEAFWTLQNQQQVLYELYKFINVISWSAARMIALCKQLHLYGSNIVLDIIISL